MRLSEAKATLVAAALLLTFEFVSPFTAHSADFDPTADAVLCIQLEVAARVAAQVVLEVDSVRLSGDRVGSRTLPVSRGVLSSRDLAGTAPVWIDVALEPDVYDTLTITFSSARVRVDRAWTELDSTALVVQIPFERRLASADGLVLSLEWRVDALAVDDPQWRPVFVLTEPALPALGARVYVAQSNSGTVGVVDRSTGRLAGVLPTGGSPVDLAWAEAARRLFVAVAERDEVVAYEIGEYDAPRRVPLRFGDGPRRILVSSDEQRVAVLCSEGSALVLLSTSSLVETERINLSPRSASMAEDPRSGRLFVTSELAGEIRVIDPHDSGAPVVFTGLDAPREITYLEGENRVAVAVSRGRRIELRDARSGALLETLDTCGPVRSMAYQPRSRRLFAALSGCDEIAILRPDQAVEIGGESIPGAPALLLLDPEDRNLLVPIPGLDQVLLIRTTRTGERDILWTGRGPVAVVVP